jgi:hypothetical protein
MKELKKLSRTLYRLVDLRLVKLENRVLRRISAAKVDEINA